MEKIILKDGTIRVYQNGTQINTLYGANYEQYVSISQGVDILYGNCKCFNTSSVRATNPCGYSQEHKYVSSNKQTIDISVNKVVSSIVATLLARLIHPNIGNVVGYITSIVQLSVDKGADYIDISETKYYVHIPNVKDMNCYHAFYEYYNKTATGGKSIIGTKWIYTQELL